MAESAADRQKFADWVEENRETLIYLWGSENYSGRLTFMKELYSLKQKIGEREEELVQLKWNVGAS